MLRVNNKGVLFMDPSYEVDKDGEVWGPGYNAFIAHKIDMPAGLYDIIVKTNDNARAIKEVNVVASRLDDPNIPLPGDDEANIKIGLCAVDSSVLSIIDYEYYIDHYYCKSKKSLLADDILFGPIDLITSDLWVSFILTGIDDNVYPVYKNENNTVVTIKFI